MASYSELQKQYNDAYKKAQDFNSNRTWIETSFLGDLFGIKHQGDQKQALLNSYATNAFNSAEAQRGREWQEYMSNTAYQRGAKDLQAIGFSPMALIGGSGASTGANYSAQGSSAGVPGSDGGAGIIASLIKVIGILAGKPSISNIAIGGKKSFTKDLTSTYDGLSWDQLLDVIDPPKH